MKNVASKLIQFKGFSQMSFQQNNSQLHSVRIKISMYCTIGISALHNILLYCAKAFAAADIDGKFVAKRI